MGKNKKRATHISTLGSQMTSIVSVALVLFILGLLAMGAIAGRSVTDEIRSNIGFVIKAAPEASPAEINRLKTLLGSTEGVASYVFTTADEILARESEYIGEDIAAMLEVNPYTSEFDVKVTPPYACTDSIEALTAGLVLMPAVGEIVTETSVVDSITTALRRIGAVLALVALALLVISFVLINNMISLSIYSRRFVIHTMKLVGAGSGFIRRPFVRAGLLNGLISAVAASAACALVRYYADSIDAIIGATITWTDMALIFCGLILAGLLICGLAAALATNRYLRSSYDEMFLK